MGGILTSDDARPRANERLMRAGRDCGNSLLEPYLLQACAGDWQAPLRRGFTLGRCPALCLTLMQQGVAARTRLPDEKILVLSAALTLLRRSRLAHGLLRRVRRVR
jgi:hypothetical protein